MRTTRLLIALLLLLAAAELYSQNLPPVIPEEVDLGVNGILLDDAVSTVNVLGDSLIFLEDTPYESFPHVNYINEDSTELLVLILYYGSVTNEFSLFKIAKFTQPFTEKFTVLPSVGSFKTFKGITLGMTIQKVKNIFGNNLKKEIIRDEVKLAYNLTSEYPPNYERDSFLNFYNMYCYYGEYTFKNNHLIKMEFGFSYP